MLELYFLLHLDRDHWNCTFENKKKKPATISFSRRSHELAADLFELAADLFDWFRSSEFTD